MANAKFAANKDKVAKASWRLVAPIGQEAARWGKHFAPPAGAERAAPGRGRGRTLGRLATIASLVVALLIGLSGTASAGGPFIKIPWGSGISEGAIWYRDEFNISAGRNVTVFNFKYPNGATGSIAFESVPPGPLVDRGATAIVGHAERRLGQLLEENGIDADDVTDIYSELAPCYYQHCDTWITSMFRNAKVYYSFDYGPDKAGNRAGIRALKAAVKQHNAEREEAEDVMDPPGDQPEAGELTEALSGPAAADPGGIDFSSLELRYLAVSGPHGGDVHFAMTGSPTLTPTATTTGLQTAREDSAAFFTWLALPPSTFWVNLSPNSPPRVIDPQFAQTNAGRVLLQSDLLLKEATVPALGPDRPNALEFWRQVYQLPGPAVSHLCSSFRIWIVPGVATVHATSTQLYILSAPLKVELAPVTHLPGKLLANICPQTPWVRGYDALYRKLIVPELEAAVNTAPQFAPLRRVYMSRVAAQWVRQDVGPRTVLGRLVNSGSIAHWRAQPPWSPLAIWEQYLKDYHTAQARYTVPVQRGRCSALRGCSPGTTFVTQTVNGGVDFSHVTEVNTSTREFDAQWPGLAAEASRSTSQASTGDGTVWLGATTNAQPNRLPVPLLVPRAVTSALPHVPHQ
jgi:Xanthomonas XOO_2897-like deaminase